MRARLASTAKSVVSVADVSIATTNVHNAARARQLTATSTATSTTSRQELRLVLELLRQVPVDDEVQPVQRQRLLLSALLHLHQQIDRVLPRLRRLEERIVLE